MEKRVKFDFEIYFTNGGSLEGKNISEQELADYLVKDLRLLMVGETKILYFTRGKLVIFYYQRIEISMIANRSFHV